MNRKIIGKILGFLLVMETSAVRKVIMMEDVTTESHRTKQRLTSSVIFAYP